MTAIPLDVPVHAVHGIEDTTVPMSQSESYTAAAGAAGMTVWLTKVPGDHYDLIDPRSTAYRECRELVRQLLA